MPYPLPEHERTAEFKEMVFGIPPTEDLDFKLYFFAEKQHREKQMAKKSYILREAERLTFSDRNETYGSPLDDFSKTAKIITGILLPKLKEGMEVTAEEFALIMVGCKISRLLQTPDHLDSMVDGPGYFNTYWMCREERRRREGKDKLAPEIKDAETFDVPLKTNTTLYAFDEEKGEFVPVGKVK